MERRERRTEHDEREIMHGTEPRQVEAVVNYESSR